MSIELKSCPFCGGSNVSPHMRDHRPDVDCLDCDTITTFYVKDRTIENAANIWNTRATAPDQPDECRAAFDKHYRPCLGSPDDVALDRGNAWHNFNAGWNARPIMRESIYRGEPTEDAEKNLYEALCWAVTEKDRNAMILVDKEAQGDLFAVAYHKANISALNYILGFLHSHPINNKRNEIEDGSPHE